jgi:hypothetical protein
MFFNGTERQEQTVYYSQSNSKRHALGGSGVNH